MLGVTGGNKLLYYLLIPWVNKLSVLVFYLNSLCVALISFGWECGFTISVHYYTLKSPLCSRVSSLNWIWYLKPHRKQMHLHSMDFSLRRQKMYGLFNPISRPRKIGYHLPLPPQWGDIWFIFGILYWTVRFQGKSFILENAYLLLKNLFFIKAILKISDLKSGFTADQVKQLYKNGFHGGYRLNTKNHWRAFGIRKLGQPFCQPWSFSN